MARSNHIINSLVAGEASPKFLGRTDAQQYNQSCEDTLNALIYPQGGGGRRPGTIAVENLSTCNALTGTETLVDAKMIPFRASTGRRFQIVFMRTYDSSTSKYRMRIRAYNVANMVDTTTTFSAAPFMMDYNSTVDTDGWAKVARHFEKFQYAQSGDLMVIAYGEGEPIQIRFTSYLGTDAFKLAPWSDSTYVPGRLYYNTHPFDVPFYEASTTKTWTVALTGVLQVSLTWGGSLGVGDGFTERTWPGTIIKLSKSSQTLVVRCNSVAGSVLSCSVIGGSAAALPMTVGDTAGESYEYCSWNPDYGYPRSVCFFESRIVFGGNKQFPDTLWFSKINQIYQIMVLRLEQDPDFTDPVADSDPFEQTLKADIVGRIQWMSPGSTITVGTNFREFIVFGPDSSLSIGPLNTTSKAETPHGSAYTMPVRVENTTVFLQRDRRTLRELVYSLEEDSFKADTLNIIGEHMAKKSTFNGFGSGTSGGNFREMVIQQTPFPIIWARDNNGALCALTRDRTQQVVAWHYHEIAGDGAYVGSDEFKPKVRSLSSIQYPGDVELDEVWMIVSRGKKVSGTWVEHFFVERMSKEWESRTLAVEEWEFYDYTDYDERTENVPCYMDGTTLHNQDSPDPAALTVITASEGQVVHVLCNGVYFGEYTVSAAGTIDITTKLEAYGFDSGDWMALVGFNYLANIVPSIAEVPAQLGSSMAQPRSIDEIAIHFYRSVGCKFGRYSEENEGDTPVDDLEEIEFPAPAASNVPYSLFTGYKQIKFPPSIANRPRIQIQSHLPLPMQITHVVAHMVVYE